MVRTLLKASTFGPLISAQPPGKSERRGFRGAKNYAALEECIISGGRFSPFASFTTGLLLSFNFGAQGGSLEVHESRRVQSELSHADIVTAPVRQAEHRHVKLAAPRPSNRTTVLMLSRPLVHQFNRQLELRLSQNDLHQEATQ